MSEGTWEIDGVEELGDRMGELGDEWGRWRWIRGTWR
jgi:hypothetical protein